MSFSNEVGSHPVGYSYERYTRSESKNVQVGDIVFFSDPDAGFHAGGCEAVMHDEFAGYVKKVYAVEYDHSDEISPEVSAHGPAGRLDVDAPYVAVVPTSGELGNRGFPMTDRTWGNRSGAANSMAERLHDSPEHDNYYQRQHHLDPEAVPIDADDMRLCSECKEMDGETTKIFGN